jgi:hypothetical protein
LFNVVLSTAETIYGNILTAALLMWKKNEVAPVEVMRAYTTGKAPLQSFLTLAPDGGG